MPAKRTRIPRICGECGTTFEVIPADIRKGGGVYCLMACYNVAKRRRSVQRTCATCGAPFLQAPHEAALSKNAFCSKRCQHLRGAGIFIPSDDGVSALIPIMHGRTGEIRAYAIVDLDDAKRLTQFAWRIKGSYAVRAVSINGKVTIIRMHRDVLGLNDERVTDHINRNKLDNRKNNLRAVTEPQNGHNKPSCAGSTSQYRGVSRAHGGKWQAAVKVNGKNVYLGTFDIEEEAAEVARLARLRLLTHAVD